MTSPDSGSTRPLRVAGVVLLGVAALALIIGLITMFGGNGDGRADGNGEERPPEPTSTSSSSRPGSPPSSASTSKSVPPTSTTSSSGQTTTTTTTTRTRPPGDNNGEPGKTVPVRVLNNSKIKGLAATAKADLEADGWQVVEVGNYSTTNVPETTVYFRPGTAEEAAARALAASFGLPVAPRMDTLADRPAGVIVIVTNDYANPPGGGKNEG